MKTAERREGTAKGKVQTAERREKTPEEREKTEERRHQRAYIFKSLIISHNENVKIWKNETYEKKGKYLVRFRIQQFGKMENLDQLVKDCELKYIENFEFKI